MPYIISPHNHNRLYVLANVLFRSENRGDKYTVAGGDLTRALDRDTFTVMGRKWGPDAVNKHLYTNDLSVGTALDESPLREGLLYVGTDDGLIQVSENGGRTWRATGFVSRRAGLHVRLEGARVAPSTRTSSTRRSTTCFEETSIRIY